jgi:hypothetical protein
MAETINSLVALSDAAAELVERNRKQHRRCSRGRPVALKRHPLAFRRHRHC